MLIANKSQKIALEIFYFMTQLDGHQTDEELSKNIKIFDDFSSPQSWLKTV